MGGMIFLHVLVPSVGVSFFMQIVYVLMVSVRSIQHDILQYLYWFASFAGAAQFVCSNSVTSDRERHKILLELRHIFSVSRLRSFSTIFSAPLKDSR